jgi:hypothetical protein
VTTQVEAEPALAEAVAADVAEAARQAMVERVLAALAADPAAPALSEAERDEIVQRILDRVQGDGGPAAAPDQESEPPVPAEEPISSNGTTPHDEEAETVIVLEVGEPLTEAEATEAASENGVRYHASDTETSEPEAEAEAPPSRGPVERDGDEREGALVGPALRPLITPKRRRYRRFGTDR